MGIDNPQPAEGDGAVAVVTSTGYPQWLVSWLESPEYRQLPTGTKLYTRPAPTAQASEQPAAVDEAMVERAFNAWCDVADVDEWRVRNTPEALRAALIAALATGEQP